MLSFTYMFICINPISSLHKRSTLNISKFLCFRVATSTTCMNVIKKKLKYMMKKKLPAVCFYFRQNLL